jgi:hypothetical protein
LAGFAVLLLAAIFIFAGCDTGTGGSGGTNSGNGNNGNNGTGTGSIVGTW